ncbi:MAG: adenine deaminase [Candidatus Hadarchaeum sp.]|uniref:adenine deaminase n=1 Tax=Candidatus Hadarchaeum sp. TaxID=2883567 RepID=UPI0031736439
MYKRIIKTALKELPADLILSNCNLLNVFTGEISRTDISIAAGRIASIDKSSGKAKKVLDCSQYYAVPGLLDGHVHLDSTLLTPTQLSKIILPCGTTTVFIDPMEIANVLGLRGINSLLEDAWGSPLKTYVQISSRVPTAPGLETTGAVLGVREVVRMIRWGTVVGLGELDPSKVIPPQDEYLLKVIATKKSWKVRVGHAAGLSGAELNAYASAGIGDDHECVTAEEALERIRVGMKVMIREGSSERNLEELIKLIIKSGQDPRNFFFCTDDKHPNDIVKEGHIDYNVRKAISLGLDPIKAIQLATINCAEHFRLDDDVGSIAPGRFADVILVRDLEKFKPEIVIANGKIVAKKGKLLVGLREYRWPAWSTNTIKIKRDVMPADFEINSSKEVQAVRVIQIIEGQIINKEIKTELAVREGKVIVNTANDILKIACVERHKRTGNIATAFVKGFELKEGAIASSVAHDHHNIVVVGASEADMARAVNEIKRMGGGLVAVNQGKILEKLELPVAGLMSMHSPEIVTRKLEKLNQAARQLGCKLNAPFMTLSFISLPTVPELGLTDKGLVDVRSRRIVPVKLD